jgi:hypothetical protein
MTKPIYEEHTSEMGNKSIKRTDPDGTIWWIPTDVMNSDYQAYLNKDKVNDEAETI